MSCLVVCVCVCEFVAVTVSSEGLAGETVKIDQ